MSEKAFRNKVCWFTFAYSILVVWTHSYNAELFLGKTQEAEWVAAFEYVLGGMIAQFAVPGFFMISAYLFYRNFSMEKLGAKWMSRIQSVLFPFLVWNFIYYIGYVIASRLPFLNEVVGKGKVPFGLIPAADAILHYTYNYVFWYLYQLILLILLAPVLYGILKRKAWGVVCLFVVGTLAGCGVVIPQLNLDALFYYCGGAWAAMHHREWIEGAWNRKKGAAGAAILAMVVIAGAADAFCESRHLIRVVLSRFLVPFALWLAIPEWAFGEVRGWMQHSFFLYATHFAVVRLVNKIAAQVPWRPPVLPVVLYLAMPFLAAAFSFFAGKKLRRYLPLFWTLLNGGRGSQKETGKTSD